MSREGAQTRLTKELRDKTSKTQASAITDDLSITGPCEQRSSERRHEEGAKRQGKTRQTPPPDALTDNLVEVSDAVVMAVHVGAVERRELATILKEQAAPGVSQQLQTGQATEGRGHVHRRYFRGGGKGADVGVGWREGRGGVGRRGEGRGGEGKGKGRGEGRRGGERGRGGVRRRGE